MRFYTKRPPFYCGIDLHARTMYICLPVRPNLAVHPRLRYALGMHARPHLITARGDAMPLLLAHMPRMALPTVMDTQWPAHGHWSGRRLGWVSPLWLRSIVSRGEHRRVPVAPGGAHRLCTLQTVTGHAVERRAGTDDRRASGLRHWRDAHRWGPCESRLPPRTVRAYAWRPERLPVASPTARAEARGRPEGGWPGGPRQDERPDVPPGQGLQAVREPVGRPLATEVSSGARADAPLSGPCLTRVQKRGGRGGLQSRRAPCAGAGAVQRARPDARRGTTSSSATASRTVCGGAPTSTPRRTQGERRRLGPLRCRQRRPPRWRCAWTRWPWRQRCAGGAGGFPVPRNRASRSGGRTPWWPPAGHRWWHAVWADARGVRGRSPRCLGHETTMPRGGGGWDRWRYGSCRWWRAWCGVSGRLQNSVRPCCL
jgi:hypothetical protein